MKILNEKEKEKNLIIDDNIEQMETDEIDDKLFKEERKKYILKGLSSLASCIINTYGYFSIWVLGNSVVYLISFRRHYNPKITFSYGYFLFPIMNFSLDLTSPIGGILEHKIGGKSTIILSTLILCISLLLLYISRNIFFDYIIMSLIGFGIAVGINITRKNICSYFMKRKALICGILYLIPGFLCSFLNIFNEKYILNPFSENPTIENVYYNEKIFLNFQKLIIFEIGFLIVTTAITLVLYYPNDPKETIKFGFNDEAQDNEKNNDNNENKANGLKKSKIKKAIYSIRTLNLYIMIFLFYPTIDFMYNSWRPIGIYYKIDTYYLQLTTALYNIVSSISSIIFSLIGDKIQFRIIFVLFSFILTISAFLFPLSVYNHIFFISEVMTMSFVLAGFYILLDPHIMKVYGMDNFIEIGGIIRSSGGFSEMFTIVFAFYLENYFSGNKNYVYKIMYYISGSFNIISLILGLFETDEKFNYND